MTDLNKVVGNRDDPWAPGNPHGDNPGELSQWDRSDLVSDRIAKMRQDRERRRSGPREQQPVIPETLVKDAEETFMLADAYEAGVTDALSKLGEWAGEFVKVSAKKQKEYSNAGVLTGAIPGPIGLAAAPLLADEGHRAKVLGGTLAGQTLGGMGGAALGMGAGALIGRRMGGPKMVGNTHHHLPKGLGKKISRGVGELGEGLGIKGLSHGAEEAIEELAPALNAKLENLNPKRYLGGALGAAAGTGLGGLAGASIGGGVGAYQARKPGER